MIESPINSKEYRELIIEDTEEEERRIKDFAHMRVPTFSSIGKQSEVSRFYH